MRPAYASDHTIRTLLDRAWGLQLRCAACGRTERWYRSRLLTFPADVSINALAARCRCGDCGSREGVVSVIDDGGERSLRAQNAKSPPAGEG